MELSWADSVHILIEEFVNQSPLSFAQPWRPAEDGTYRIGSNMLRHCLCEPIPEIEIAAHQLNDAVSAHLRGERGLAESLLRQADNQVLWDWLNSVWGKNSANNQPRRLLADPPTLTKTQRAKPRNPTAETKRLIHQRDGYYCRFCKIPVIRGEVRKAIRIEYPHAVPWEGTNATQHAAFQLMWAQYDHILPHARGGHSDLENVYLTCAACNYGRSNHLLEEFDLFHPSLHPPRQGKWDGLERFHNNDENGQNLLVVTSTFSNIN